MSWTIPYEHTIGSTFEENTQFHKDFNVLLSPVTKLKWDLFLGRKITAVHVPKFNLFLGFALFEVDSLGVP